MTRSLSSLSPRRRFALGAVALALALGIGGLTVRAVEPKARRNDPPAAPAVPAEPATPVARTIEGTILDRDGRPISEAVVVQGDGDGDTWTYRAAQDVALKPGETAEVTLELIRGVDVEGKVVAQDSTRPVPLAQVGVYGSYRPRSGGRTSMARTDAQGRYHYRLPPGETYLYVMGPPAGYTGLPRNGSSRTVTIPDGVTRFAVPPLELAAAVTVSGRVFDAAGAPIEGPRDVGSDELAGVVVDAQGQPVEGVEVDAWTWYPGNETKTDRTGVFRLSKLGKQRKDTRIEVLFRKPGYTPQLFLTQPTGVAGWVVVLGQRTYFEGTVTARDGKPAAGALIRANNGPKQADGVLISDIWTEAKTDENGHYRMYAQADVYDIQVGVPGRGVARFPRTAIGADEARRLDIRLEPGVAFRARTIDATTGAPVAGVRLSHWQHPGVEGSSGPDGLVRIADMMPGKFDFEVEAKGYARWWSEQCLSEWNRRTTIARLGGWQRNFDDLDFDLSPAMGPVTITLERGVTIDGRVLDPDGNPVAGATVAPALTGTGNSLTGDTRFSAETDAAGRFTQLLPASGDRDYNLVAHDGKYNQWRTWANGVLPPFRTKPGEALHEITLRLTRPATVRGRVTDAQGQPAAGREVRAHATDLRENRYYDPQARTGDDGTYELKYLRPGEHYIQVAPFWLEARQAPEGTSRAVTLGPEESRSGVDFQLPGK